MRISLRMLEPSDSVGGRLAAQPVGAFCHSPVNVRWPSAQPVEAGRTAEAVARWIPWRGAAGRASGTLIILSVSRLSGAPSPSERLRTATARASRILYGPRAPMVDALILGRRSGIQRSLQDHFAQSGLVHLLSISGFHVGIITAWIFLCCRLLRCRREPALGVAACAGVAYVAFLGWPAPATRAAALAVLLALSRARQRRVESDALLSATCLCVLLVDPWAILDLGGWLSVAALWGATTFSRWTDRALGTSVWWRTLGSSVGATLATAPITAGTLGAVAVVGIALNFVAVPLAAIAVPGVLASLLVLPFSPDLAAALAGGAGLALHLLELLAITGAAIPYGHTVGPPDGWFAMPWALALGASLWCIGNRNSPAEAVRRCSWSLVLALWGRLLWAALPPSSDGGSGLALHFLDVGQGDGAVLRTPAGRWVVLDAGPRSEQDDAGRRVMVPFLMSRRVRELALVVVSHAHADHLGGVASLLDRYPAGLVLEPGVRVPDPLYYRFLDGLAADSIPWHPGRRGERWVLDGVTFTILHPDPAWESWGEDVNEDSLVLLVEYGGFQALFAGDAGFPAESAMRSRARRVDLLKVGHHGSRGSTGEEWLDSLRPQVAIISLGRNTYGHPAPQTLARLLRRRIEVWRTDQDGGITVLTDGRVMRVEAQARVATYDVR
ncbi:MAG TPA: DNA internalization-related competence protein ComEC/Rec2 [Gemmatimonadales bacterium]